MNNGQILIKTFSEDQIQEDVNLFQVKTNLDLVWN